jgi:osmotically-inducible protein OsmY
MNMKILKNLLSCAGSPRPLTGGLGMTGSGILVLFLLCSLSACSPISFLSSSTTALDSSSQTRGLGGYVSDGELRTRYHFALFDHDHKLFYYVKSNVYEGRLLLTGCVPTVEMQEDAVRIAWQVQGIQSVINELTVSEGKGFVQSAQDKWIATKLNTILLFDEKVNSRNYEILVVDGTVFFVGVARSQKELDAAIERAQGVSGVKKVVSYVRVITNFEDMHRKKQDNSRPSDADLRRKARTESRDPNARIVSSQSVKRD